MAFIQYLEAHVPIWNFSMTFWYIFYIFYVYLNFSRKSKFELQVHEILEFSDSKSDIHVFLVYFEAVCRDIHEISNICFTKHDHQLV